MTGNVATHRKVFAPFLLSAFDRKMIPFFHFFFIFSIMCRRVVNKTIILLGLAGYEMNQLGPTRLVVISYPTPACGINVKYTYIGTIRVLNFLNSNKKIQL